MADLSITAADVQPASDTRKKTVTAGATITAGQAVYLDTTDSNKAKLADASAQASSVAEGIALHGAASGQPLTIAIGGGIDLGATLAVGKPTL
jgi:predicted transcriptional regulator